jgi:hypothetical protein
VLAVLAAQINILDQMVQILILVQVEVILLLQ